MNREKYRTSVLLSIFKRKGGEGELTKIVNDKNRSFYTNQLIHLENNEVAILCFKRDDSNWILITNNRVLFKEINTELSLPFLDIIEVTPAVKEEFNARVISKMNFTKLILRDIHGNEHILNIERGNPFRGIYQLLHYVVLNNHSIDI